MITSQLLTIRELKNDMSHARFARATESSEKSENRDVTKTQTNISRNGAKKHGRSGDLSFGPSQALAKLIGRPDRQHQMALSLKMSATLSYFLPLPALTSSIACRVSGLGMRGSKGRP
jgi:hypothetical protein